MTAQSNEFDCFCILVNPDQKEIALYVALHRSTILSLQWVRIKFFGNFSSLFQVLEYLIQSNQFLLVMQILLEVLLELPTLLNCVHGPTMKLSVFPTRCD